MTDQPDPLPAHEAQVRAYAAESGDVVLRRHLTAVLAEYDAMREELERVRHAFKMLNIEYQAALEKITELCAELKGKPVEKAAAAPSEFWRVSPTVQFMSLDEMHELDQLLNDLWREMGSKP